MTAVAAGTPLNLTQLFTSLTALVETEVRAELATHRTDAANRLFGVAKLQVDEAADDSDKSFTVPADKVWEILSIWAELVTTATTTARQMEVQIQDASADVIAQFQAGVTQIESLTRNYLFAPGLTDLTSLRDGTFLTTPMPKLILPESFVVRVFDNNAVDAAADDMVVQMLVMERTEI